MDNRNHPQKPKELSFKPITDGLGFRPFADGLPYAPTVKTSNTPPPKPAPLLPKRSLSSGTGAVAAGPPLFYSPQRVSVPINNPASTLVQQKVIINYGVSYLIKRIFAYGLDTTLNTVLCAAALVGVLYKMNINLEVLLLNPSILFLPALFLVVFNWAMMTAQEVVFRTSFGKWMFGLTLKGSTAAVFFRALLFIPSLSFCAVGLLWGLINSKRRCWHDIAANLQPEEFTRL